MISVIDTGRLLSNLWDRAPKDCTEGKACSKVLSQPEWKPNQQTGQMLITGRARCHLCGSNLWLPECIISQARPLFLFLFQKIGSGQMTVVV